MSEKFQGFFVACKAVEEAVPTVATELPSSAAGIVFPAVGAGSAPVLQPSTRARRAALLPLIRKVANEYRIDADLLAAIVHVESRYRSNAVSAKGALGLMQIMPDTGRRYGVSDVSALLSDQYLNLSVGARYLRDLFRMFDDRVDLVLAAYNAGEEAVRRNQNAVPPYRETQAYVRSVMSARGASVAHR